MLHPPPLPRNVEAALRDLSSTKGATRASAINDLVRHATKSDDLRARSLPLLENALKTDDAPEARAAAAVALGDLHAEHALPSLLLAIEDDSVHVRQMALNALGEIGDARAEPRLLRALSDERPEVRYQATIAYARVARDADDVEKALVHALDDEDEAVRYIAIRVAEERLESGVAKPSPAFVARVRELLDCKNAHVALASAIFLAKTGDASARAIVLRVVEGGRVGTSAPEPEDEREAVELAGHLELREAIPHLERRAWGLASRWRDTCAWHAKIALARMGHARAKDEILRDLAASKDDTRAAAVVAAGRARLVEARPAIERVRGVDPDLVADALAKLG